MPQFIFVYIGGEYPTSPEEGQKHLHEYQQWLESLGDAVVSPAVPFKDTHTVHSDGRTEPGSIAAMSGLSIISASSLQEALSIAQSCPFLEIKGTLEVSEMIDMTNSPSDVGSQSVN